MTQSDARSRWRQYAAEHLQGPSSTVDMTVVIAGSFTVDPLVPYVGAHLLGNHFTPQLAVGPFNQIRQICLDHEAVLGRDDMNAIVLLWRLEDLFPELLARCLYDAAAREELLQEIRELAEAVARLRAAFKGILIVSAPPYPTTPGFEISDIRQASTGMATFHAVSTMWVDHMSRLERVRLMDLHGAVLRSGMRSAHDARKWMLYRQPYTESFLAEMGQMLGRILAAETRSPKKCIVLDLDNTLWGGIIGEDGLAGIQLSDEFPGRAYRDFQRRLLSLKRKGILLAVASKNNPADAYEVFDRHDAMVLSRSDIAAFEIHWNSKVDSITRIAKALNIGIDSLVFVDDSAKEIGEVRERLPEVTCVMVPEEAAEIPDLLADTDYFDFAEVTDEDRQRTDMIAADTLRKQTRESMSEEEFRKSLGLQIDVFRADRQHLARVTQLINKTNQFNLTTIRRTHDEVEALASAPDAAVLAMTVRDKYGDYGLVGVAILKKEHPSCLIDTLLMSCRVLGRGAEEALVANVMEAAVQLDCSDVRGRYIPTPKNGMVKGLYERFGFAYDPVSDTWTQAITGNQAPLRPSQIASAVVG